jgi:steroid 5-alpha reductase family enzyme
VVEFSLVLNYALVAIGAFFLAIYFNKLSIVDLVWSIGLALGSLVLISEMDVVSLREGLILVLVLAWSFRLSFYLFKNRVLKKHEDPRYNRLIQASSKYWQIVFLVLFLFQVVLVWLFLCPIHTALTVPTEDLRFVDIVAFLWGLIALLGESISDNQLKVFCANSANKGRVCKIGLWRYSRHPNYFFEWVFWWAFVLFSIGSDAFELSLLGPILMYLFLRYISGVPFAELSSIERRGSEYLQYQKETSVFFPFKPKL